MRLLMKGGGLAASALAACLMAASGAYAQEKKEETPFWAIGRPEAGPGNAMAPVAALPVPAPAGIARGRIALVVAQTGAVRQCRTEICGFGMAVRTNRQTREAPGRVSGPGAPAFVGRRGPSLRAARATRPSVLAAGRRRS